MTALAIVVAGVIETGIDDASLLRALHRAALALGWQWFLFALAELFVWCAIGRD